MTQLARPGTVCQLRRHLERKPAIPYMFGVPYELLNVAFQLLHLPPLTVARVEVPPVVAKLGLGHNLHWFLSSHCVNRSRARADPAGKRPPVPDKSSLRWKPGCSSLSMR